LSRSEKGKLTTNEKKRKFGSSSDEIRGKKLRVRTLKMGRKGIATRPKDKTSRRRCYVGPHRLTTKEVTEKGEYLLDEAKRRIIKRKIITKIGSKGKW